LETLRSLGAIQTALKENTLTLGELVEQYLAQIAQHNGELHAFLDVYDTQARAQAKTIQAKIEQGTAGKLAGAVIGIKDVISHKDHGLQASSQILNGFEAQFNATAIERLLTEDAIIIGRQNCDEFAMGSSNENSSFGPVKNFADTSRVPGGSSGGSAVAVQAGMCLASLGSDTGGSVRQPAAFCGVVGLKPTYSRISRWGLIAYGSSFDQIGIFSNNVQDCATILEVIAGPDEYDSTVSKAPVPAYSQDFTLPKQLKIGYIKETLEAEGLQPAIKQETTQTLDWLKAQGHTVEPVSFPLLDYVLPTYYILTTAEASSNLSRFDGVKYGFRSNEVTDLESLYKKTRAQGFGPEVKRRIMLGTFVLSASYYDAYYTKAQKVRRLIKEQTQEMFKSYDFLLVPTTPTTAFKLGEHTQNPLEMYLADLYTVQASVAGIPAISVPNGQDESGLPIGLQVMADYFEEHNLLAFSRYLENQKSQ